MVPSVANPSSSIDLRLLGPITVVVDGQPVPIGGPRQMAVLARLMLTPDHVVTMDQLVDSVWDGDEPTQPHVAVRSYISNLRRAIEPHRRRRASDSCLASSPPGYRLAVDPASIDWIRFERLINDGRQQLAAGDWATAVLMLRHALSLWAGKPFSGLPESPFFVAQQARLTDLRDTAMELLFEALVVGGDHASVAAEVDSAIADSPLRERLTELGMLALYRSGRQSEALALGQRLRARLLDELGVDPSPAIDAIELKILNHDRSLEATAGPSLELDAGTDVATAPNPTGATAASSVGDRRTPDHLAAPQPPGPAHHEPGDTTPHTAQDTTAHDVTGRGVAGTVAPAAGDDAVGLAAPDPVAGSTRGRDGDWAAPTVGDARRDRSPQPRAGVLVPAVPIGRHAELETLDSIWATLRAGRSATAVITGEQGIGKTTLAGSIAQSIAERGATVAWSRTVAEPMAPLWPWAQIVLALLDTADPETVGPTSDLAPLASLGASVAAALGQPPVIGSDRSEIMLAMTRLLERLARRAPVLLLFEDLQWSDHESVALLNHAASTLADRRVGFLATWRDTDTAPPRTAAAMRELARLPSSIRLELVGLDQPAIGELAQSMGRKLTIDQILDVRRRTGGNPLFVRELLAHADMTVGEGHHWSKLIDTVVDRVARLHPLAIPVLEVAALFEHEFTSDVLASVCGQPVHTVEEVLDAAVRSRVLDDDRLIPGTHRFGQPVVAEVLASKLLATTRAEKHEAIGRHLMETDGPGHGVAHHLSRSRSVEDRLLAAQIALASFNRGGDGHRPAAMDEYVRLGGEARRRLQRDGAEPIGADVELDELGYLSWRDWVDGRPADWSSSARRWLKRALELSPTAPAGRGHTRPKTTETDRRTPDLLGSERPDERLERAVMNIIGQPMQAVGPTLTAELVTMSESDLETVTEAVDRLAVDNPVRWVAKIHLSSLGGLAKPGLAGQTKAMREAQKLANTARKRVRADSVALVQQALLSRFCDVLEPEDTLSMLEELAELDPGRATELFVLRHGYPTMLELGRTIEAADRTEEVLQRVTAGTNPYQLAEARLLRIRHLLWTGRLDVAEEELDRAMADWTGLGLGQAQPLVRQRRTLRLLRRRPLADDHVPDGHGPDGHHQLLVERAGPSELALRLARIGDDRLANEHLDAMVATATVRHLSPSDQALVAAAALVVGHEKAALTVQDLLMAYGDRLIVRPDGSVVLGPASLYAGLAARAAGDEKAAAALIETGFQAVRRLGGSPASADVVVNHLRPPGHSNPVPTNP